MAEARSAVSEPRVTELEEGKDTTKDFLRAWRKAFFRRFFRTRNLIRNGMWPTSLWNLAVTTSLFSIFLVGDWQWAQPVNSRLWYLAEVFHLNENVPFLIRVLIISVIGGILFFVILMYKRRWLLRVLLSYRGWMYEPPRKMSLKTMFWGLLVRLVSGYKPSLYSGQKSLPFLPVPNLNGTIDKFILSLEPLYGKDSEEYKNFKDLSEDFKKNLGPKLQRILIMKSWWAQNWVTDWWEKYVYLMGRTPTAINSNYYVLDHGYWKPTDKQIARAASTIYQFMKVQRTIAREELRPLVIRNTIPVCMSQYERVFATTRIPGEDFDTLETYPDSKYIVVSHKGIYYKLDVFDKRGQLALPQNLQEKLKWIIEDADKHLGDYSEAARSLAALTAIERTEWAQTRSSFFRTGVNKDSLDVLDQALFHVVLDTVAFDTWSDRGKYMLHADGKTLWFDKSFSLLFFKDGKLGLNAEHSWGDGPVVAHVLEANLTEETLSEFDCEFKRAVSLYDENGWVKPVHDFKQAALAQPERLVWEVSKQLEDKIYKAIEYNIKNNDDLDLVIFDHNMFGKGFIKTCKVSPDAFFQQALHLAYFRQSGDKFALTYESSMTRLYLNGRTETVRSLTNGTAAFVKAMMDENSKNEERISLLRKACAGHTILYKDAMNGKGIDRHMFGLYVVSKGMGHESEFLSKALMMPWTLSTSQQPQQQIAESPDCHDFRFKDLLCPGGGFGPVSDKGYGVSYMMAGDSRIFFHVSSKKSCPDTNSQAFVDEICKSLSDMRELFSGHDKPQEAAEVKGNKESSPKLDTPNNVQANGVNGMGPGK